MMFSKSSCNYCGKPGHKSDVCKNQMVSHKMPFTFDGYCYNCHKYGHTAYECRP